MSAQHTPGLWEPVPFGTDHLQRLTEKAGTHPNWTEFKVDTKVRDEARSSVEIRVTKDASMFVDIDITEYVGVTGRAKSCAVRLGEAASLALYGALHAKFGGGAS